MATQIPTNFVIPEGYRHTWRILCENGWVSIKTEDGKMTIEESGMFDDQDTSDCLDWIAVTVERVRMASEERSGVI